MRRTLLLISTLALALRPAAAAPEAPFAGILLYMQTADEVWLLVADDMAAARGWGGFGGHAEGDESAAQTAARETEEETRGVFRRAMLLEKIAGQVPVIDAGGFALFSAEVDYVPARFLTNQKAPDGRVYHERSHYAWVPFSAVAPLLASEIDHERVYRIDTRYLPAASPATWLWPVWLATLRTAALAGALPWVDAPEGDEP